MNVLQNEPPASRKKSATFLQSFPQSLPDSPRLADASKSPFPIRSASRARSAIQTCPITQRTLRRDPRACTEVHFPHLNSFAQPRQAGSLLGVSSICDASEVLCVAHLLAKNKLQILFRPRCLIGGLASASGEGGSFLSRPLCSFLCQKATDIASAYSVYCLPRFVDDP